MKRYDPVVECTPMGGHVFARMIEKPDGQYVPYYARDKIPGSYITSRAAYAVADEYERLTKSEVMDQSRLLDALCHVFENPEHHSDTWHDKYFSALERIEFLEWVRETAEEIARNRLNIINSFEIAAWVVYTDEGYHRLWTTNCDEAYAFAASVGKEPVPLYAKCPVP